MPRKKKQTVILDIEQRKKAALYIRVSTDRQYEEGYSVEAQKERLVTYAKLKEIDNYEFYIDGGYSGSTLERPEIQRLIKDVNDGKITDVFVFKLDRISRSQKDTIYLLEDVFAPNNVTFISLNESFDTSTPFGKAVVGILSVFAQLERENIFLRTREGMRKRVESGLWMGGGITPFGYNYNHTTGMLEPNEDAEKVKKIYDLYLQGYSLQHISDILGLKYEKLAAQILDRKSNAGFIVYNGKEYLGQHEPIVSLEIYEKAMAMRKLRAEKKLTSKSEYLLTGLVYCGKCGAKMRYQKWGKDVVKLVCYSQQSSKKYLIKDPNCDNNKIESKELENAVLEDIMRVSISFSDEIEQKTTTNAIDELILRQDTIERKIKNLYNLYAESENQILLETIAENEADLKNVIAMLEKEKNATKIKASREAVKNTIKNIADIWDTLSMKEKQQIMRTIINKISIDGDTIIIEYNM